LIAQLRRYAVTTPGRLSGALVGLVLLSLLTGVIGLLAVQGNASSLDDLAGHREPVSAAAQQIYGSLSDADATAASAFLAGGSEPAALRVRYDADIARAGAALAVAAADAGGSATGSGPLAQLSAGLPVYAGLVDRATANNEAALPVGSAYLREADNLMQTTLLPAAQSLYQADIQAVSAAQDDATSFPWLAAVLVIALIVGLVLAQRYLRRRTNRVFNVGLLVATGAVVLALLWSSLGLIMETVYVDGGQSSGSQQVQQLAQARIEGLQARTDELLTLVARGGVDYGGQFTKLANDIGGKDGSGGLIGQVRANPADDTMANQMAAATRDAGAWFHAETQISNVNNAGDYPAAVAGALDTSPGGEATIFDSLDGTLTSAIDQGRKDFTEQTDTASAWLTALPIGVLVLCLVAAGSASVGIWQRLREYR
jgi:hypothetical protein